jgi:threonine/homoserine/homoserine lactone efflux protein
MHDMALNLTAGPLAMFALVASITPGPNNLLLMRSGAAFGVRRTLRHVVGIQVGFAGLIVLAHLGIGVLLLALPGAFAVLRWSCFAYLLWLAWLILRDAQPRNAANAVEPGRPMRWIEAVLFQLINPKAWMMAITSASAFYAGAVPTHLDLAAAIVLCLSIGGPCMLIWTAWGAALDHLLKQPRARQAFSYVMALLVVGSAIWMLR